MIAACREAGRSTSAGYVRRANHAGNGTVQLSFNFWLSHPLARNLRTGFLGEIWATTPFWMFRRVITPTRRRANHLDRLLYVDVKITLGDSDLPKVTCMAEMAGIQTRFPFLDRAVAEFSGTIPARLKVKGFEKRYLFKRAFRNLLPAEIIRKKKHGFGIPVADWLKSDPRMRELSRDACFPARGPNADTSGKTFIEDLFRQHEADDSTYYGDTLWTFLVLELWHRQLVDEMARVPA